MPLFPSESWAKALLAAAEKDPAFPAELAKWDLGPVVVGVEEDSAFDEDFYLYAEAGKGRIKELSVIDSPLEREATYVITAPYLVWKSLLQKKADPLKLLREGTVKVRGDKGKLLERAKASQFLERIFQKIETKFGDD